MKRLLTIVGCALAIFLIAAAPGRGQAPVPSSSANVDAMRGKLVVTFFDMSGGIATRPRNQHLGLAVHIQTPSGRSYLYDTGSKVPPDAEPERAEFDTGRDCIAPFLKSRGISTIDGIVISHGHGDHFGGAGYLLDHVTVRRFIHPLLTLPQELFQPEKEPKQRPWIETVRRAESLLVLARMKGVEDLLVAAGDKLDWDKDLEVEVLSPFAELLRSQVSIENANSLVLRLRHGRNVFLFTADILPETQDHLIRSYPAEMLKATVMSAPHHGYDSYEPFAKVVRPEVVVVSCGANGAVLRAGRTEAAFAGVGSKIYVTPWHGTVEIVSDGNTYTVSTERSPSK